MMQIKKAQNIDDLRDCIFEIDYDKWEEMEWTLDEAKMNRVRSAKLLCVPVHVFGYQNQRGDKWPVIGSR
jgi:hypothetical protein